VVLVPILFVNGKRRGLKVRGRARVTLAGLTSNPARKRRKSRRTQPAGLKRYWAARKRGRRVIKLKRAKRRSGGWLFTAGRDLAAAKKRSSKRGRRARRSTSMARKKRRKGQPAALKRYWAARKRSGKAGRPGKTRRSKSSRRRAALKGLRRKGRKAVAAPKKRRRKARRTATRRLRGRSRRTPARKTRRTRRSRRTVRMRRSSHRRRALQAHELLAPTVRMKTNPSRKRRRKGRKSRRRGRRSHRRVHRRGRRASYRRYRRGSYRRNPGGMLMDLAKKAGWALGGFYGTRFLVSRVAPMIPGVASLGTIAGPALAVAAVLGVNFATKKVAVLARHRNELLLGSALSALDSLFQAFAPASVKSLVGMSDYIAVGGMSDYIAMSGVPPINDSMTLSDYIAVGSDGVEEELGLEEELGVEEELGNDLLGGMPGGASLMKRVPSQSFLAPIPARSFTKQIPAAGGSYDNPAQIYAGIFNGGFGR
jgi:hypothetical protein